jgi:hypothetical protein
VVKGEFKFSIRDEYDYNDGDYNLSSSLTVGKSKFSFYKNWISFKIANEDNERNSRIMYNNVYEFKGEKFYYFTDGYNQTLYLSFDFEELVYFYDYNPAKDIFNKKVIYSN